MIPLTPMQHDLLAFIRRSFAEHGVTPTYREIMTHFGFRSNSSVAQLLKGLELRGAIRVMSRKAHGIELLDGINVPLQPDLREALSQYAKRTRAGSDEVAAAELLRSVLGVA